jgi:tRNA(Ile2)-agmatinylcytidine synthase
VTDDTFKLEKFKTKTLNKTKLENPYCEDCGKSMASMGANQGYRCSSCKVTENSKNQVMVDRKLSEETWYEVPPPARRHLAKPVVRNSTNRDS